MARRKTRLIARIEAATKSRDERLAPPPSFGPPEEEDLPVELAAFVGTSLVGLLIIMGLAMLFGTRSIESKLETDTISILRSEGLRDIDVDADGLDLTMSGILPRNPRLRIVSVESGIGWLPFVKEALDHGFEYATGRKEKPEFRKRPSDYLREQVWACTFFEEFPAKHYLEEIGSDRVLFETDYPHPICLYGSEVRQKIDAAFGALPEETRHRILFSNAAELYGVAPPDRPWKNA